MKPIIRVVQCRAVALVLVLAALVLLTGLILAFFSKAVLNRQITFTSTNLARADMLARASLDLVVGELRQEIADPAGSTVHVSGSGPAIYEPASPGQMVPQRMGVAGTDAAGAVTILKVPANGLGIYPGSGIVGSNVSIQTGSANGRVITPDRWFGSQGPRLGSQATLPTWLLVTRNNGVKVPALAAARDVTADDFVIGRFTYTVYDVGGLLDANAAGHPSGWTNVQIQQVKNTLAGAKMILVGVDADRLIGWRNPLGAANYLGYIHGFASQNGFRYAQVGDTAFLGRHDLIRAADAGVAGLSPIALEHLTTFTRTGDLPSWKPITPAGSILDYAAVADVATSTNRFLPQVRFPNAATITTFADNGTATTYQVRPGDPLVQRRFPLERLAWLGPNGPRNGGTDENIQACFGLRWLPSEDVMLSPGAMVWRYVGATGTTARNSIETLAQVAAAGTAREPNFFELLQAGILTGSLGVTQGGTGIFPDVVQRASSFQVLRIGAAIVDQYDGDSCPTVIEYNQGGYPWQACGIENLPYVNLDKTVTGGDPANPSMPNSTAALAVYHLIGLWNPSQSPTAVVPPNLRLRIKGGMAVLNSWSSGLPGYSWLNGPVVYGYGYTRVLDATLALSNAAGRGAQGFANPGLPTATDVGGSLADPGPSGGGWTVTPVSLTSSSLLAPGATYVAYRLPDLFLNGNLTPGSPGWVGSYDWGYVQTCYAVGGQPFQCSLEFQTPSGAWVPYSFSHGNNDPATWQAGGSCWQTHFTAPPMAASMPSLAETYAKAPLYLTADPRSVRFGRWQYSRNYGSSGPERAPDALITSLWPTSAQIAGSPYAATFASDGYGGGGTTPADAVQIPPGFGAFYYPAQLSRNNTLNAAPASSYADRDGIRRMADSGLYTVGSANGNPYQNPADRPVILNRPFRSVAELGYAFRDMPWKSLDFFSSDSADAALLDMFSVGGPKVTVAAGCLGLNTRDTLVVQAMLQDAEPDVMNPTSVPGTAAGLAASIVASISARPLLDRSGLATQAGPALATADFPGVAEEKIKPRREAFLRSLADAGQTRTWNLLIDVVAQTGRYGPNASGLDQFIVEGERRYWLHVAIDRFTGEVIDREWELVF